MDKSVIQKFSIVMSMFVAVFTTIIVCGNIVNGSGSYSSYTVPFTNAAGDVSYSDLITVQDTEPTPVVSSSDNVTIVPFIDDEIIDDEYEADSIFTSPVNDSFSSDDDLFYTTVTTTLKPSVKITTTVKATTAVRSTTKAATTSKTTTTSATKLTTTTTATSAAQTTTHVSVSSTTASTSETSSTTASTTTASLTTASTTTIASVTSSTSAATSATASVSSESKDEE